MSAIEGALAALTGDKTIVAANQNVKTHLDSGDKLQGTIVGTGNAGSIDVDVTYYPLSESATLA